MPLMMAPKRFTAAPTPWWLVPYEDGVVHMEWRNMTDTGPGPAGGGELNVDGQFKVIAAGGVLMPLLGNLYTRMNGWFTDVQNNSTINHRLKFVFPVGTYNTSGATWFEHEANRRIKYVGTLDGINHPWEGVSTSDHTRFEPSGGDCFRFNCTDSSSEMFFEDMALGSATVASGAKGMMHDGVGDMMIYHCLVENMSDNLQSSIGTNRREQATYKVKNNVIRLGQNSQTGRRHLTYFHDLNYAEITDNLYYDPVNDAHCIKLYCEQVYVANNVLINKLDDAADHSNYTNWGSVLVDLAPCQDVVFKDNTLIGRARENGVINSSPSLQEFVRTQRRGAQYGGIGLKRPNFFVETHYVDGILLGHEPHWEQMTFNGSGTYADSRNDHLNTYANAGFFCKAVSSGGITLQTNNLCTAADNQYTIPDSAPFNGASYWQLDLVLDDGSIHSTTATSSASDKSISGATQANPVQITTTTDHNYETNNQVTISNITGMTELNDRTFTITVTGADTFTLNGEDGTAHTAYSSGGDVYVPQSFILDTAVPTGRTLVNNWSVGQAYPDSRGKDYRILNPKYHNPNDPDYIWTKIRNASLGDRFDRYNQYWSGNMFIRIGSATNQRLARHFGSAPQQRYGSGEPASTDSALPPQWYSGVGWSQPSGAGTWSESYQTSGLHGGTAPSGFQGLDGSDFEEISYLFFANNSIKVKAGPLGLGSFGTTNLYEEDVSSPDYGKSYSSPIYEVDNTGSLKRQTESPTHQVMATTTVNANETAGATVITLASATGIADGDVIHICCDDDPWDMACGYWTHRTTVNGTPSGNDVTITDALPYDASIGRDVIAFTPQPTPEYFGTDLSQFPNLKAGVILQ